LLPIESGQPDQRNDLPGRTAPERVDDGAPFGGARRILDFRTAPAVRPYAAEGAGLAGGAAVGAELSAAFAAPGG